MSQALYRTYRSKNLSEIVGQEHITTALKRALDKGTISHAYLFTGPRGTGKTSIARILAHEINGIAYDDESSHLDIIEIDAASNRRIDEIRDLRDKVHIAPTSSKYKVYIIDEVHMLTKEAFNALLKTLEEPPAHVVFMLATTEVHKLPETIISRTQRFALKPVALPQVTAHLRYIADKENIDITDAALELIAAHGQGSFRDSISLLDQIRNTGEKVDVAEVQALLGMAPKTFIEQLVGALAGHNALAVAQQLIAMHEGGYEPAQIAKQVAEALRTQLLNGAAQLDRDTLMQLLAQLIEVPSSADPKSYLEIALLDAALSGTPTPKPATPKVMQQEVAAKPAVQIEPHPSSLRKSEPKAATPEPTPMPNEEEEELEEESAKPTPTASNNVLDPSCWQAVMAAIKAKHNTLLSIVKATSPSFAPGEVTLTCGYAFHQKRLNEKRNKQLLCDIIQEVTGENVRLVCVIGDVQPLPEASGPPPLPPADEVSHTVAAPASEPPNETVATISNIFGGAEVLKS